MTLMMTNGQTGYFGNDERRGMKKPNAENNRPVENFRTSLGPGKKSFTGGAWQTRQAIDEGNRG